MKKLMIVASLMFGGATLVSAQEQQTDTRVQSQTETTIDQDQDQDKQQIAISELPEGVTAKLESQDYAGWTVGNAYKKSDESQNEIFIVEMRQGTETKKVKFDSDGNMIDKNKEYKHEDKDKADATESNQYKSEEDASTETEEDATSQEDVTPEESVDESTETTDQAENTELEQDQK